MIDNLLAAVIELLESGDDVGCDGLVVVTAKAYAQLQQVVQSMTGIQHGVQVEHQPRE